MNNVYFFANGNTANFKDDKQIPKLQVSWFKLYLKFLEENGIDPEKCKFTMPDGKKAKPFRIDNGWNWRMI